MNEWMQARVTQGYGPTSEQLDGSYMGYDHFNKGIDFSLPVGTPIDFYDQGVVIAVSNDPNHSSGWGKFAWVQTADGSIHRFNHLDAVGVKVGQQVGPGTVLGNSGNSGKSTGAHLSWDVSDPQGVYRDPAPLMQGASTTMQQPTSGDDYMGVQDYRDPQVDARYKALKKRALEAHQNWTEAGQPVDGELVTALDNAYFDLTMFEDSFGAPDAPRSSVDPAQRAFDNSLALGDLSLRQNQEGFQQWYDRNNMAAGRAADELATRDAQMASYNEYAEKASSGFYPGITQVRRGYIPEDYGDVLSRWEQRYGGGGSPSPVGGGLPSAPTEQGATNPIDAAGAIDAGTETFRPNYDAMLAPRDGAAASGPGNPDWTPGNPFTVSGSRPYSLAAGTPSAQTRPETKPGFNPLKPWEYGSSAGSQGALGSTARKAGKTAARWWQKAQDRVFAQGGVNIPAGKGYVGDGGQPEWLEVPGFGGKWVGANGPEEVDIPEGANIIPQDELFAFHEIKKAAAQQGGGMAQPQGSDMEAYARANDPELQTKVMESVKRALAAQYAAKPPSTPIPYGGANDYFAAWRPLTGVYPPEMMQEGTGGAVRNQQR